jgi:O-antigen/teichoic acid export membrane protein
MPTITTESGDLEQRRLGRQLPGIIARALAVLHRFPLASKGVLAIFDQALYSGTSFLTAVLVGRTTSPDRLGQYYLVLSIVLVIAGVVEQLVAAPYVVYSKRRQGRELAEYAGSTWAHFSIAVTVTVIGLVAAVPIVSLAGRSGIVPGLWALAVFAPLLLLRQWVRRYTFANLKLPSAVALDAAVAVMQLSALVVLGYFRLLSLFSIFAVMGGACGLACLGWYWLDRPQLRFDRTRYLADWRQNWGFGKWALQTFVLGNMTPQLMLWLVIAALGAAETGLYGACSTLVGVAYVILSGADNLITPQNAHAFATGGVRELRRVLLLANTFVVVTMGAFCLLFLLTGDSLVVLAFGPQYRGTGTILNVLAFSAFMNGLSIISGSGLWAIDQPRLNFVADACCMAVTLIAAALLIHPLGVLGAAFATLAGTSIAAAVRITTLTRYLGTGVLEQGVTEVSAIPS